MFNHWGITLVTCRHKQIVADVITRGTAVAVSDGSYQEQAGAVA